MYPYYLRRVVPVRVTDNNNTIIVEGTGRVSAEPDMAIITFGVVTSGQNLRVVQQQNDRIMRQATEALDEFGIQDKDIRTAQYSIYPQYDYVNGEQVLTGYQITNIIEVKVYNIDILAELISVEVGIGINIQRGIEFMVKDSDKYYNEALNSAIIDGRNKALAIADTLDVRLDPVPLSIEEKSSYSQAIQVARLGAINEAAIQTGEVNFIATAEIKFQIEK